MYPILRLLITLLASMRRSRASREAEILFLRQQLLVLRRSAPTRPRLRNADRLIFVWLYRLFPSLLGAALIFKPETLVRWHRGGFRLYWRWKSRRRRGRPQIPTGIRSLVRQMGRENPLWGEPRIHGELLKLGIEISQSSVAKYMAGRRKPPNRAGEHSCAITRPTLPPLISSSLGPGVFYTPWAYVDHLLVPRGASIGTSRRAEMSEAYYVMAGDGKVTVDGETVAIQRSDAIPVDLGQSKSFTAGTAPPELMTIGIAPDLKTKESFAAVAANSQGPDCGE